MPQFRIIWPVPTQQSKQKELSEVVGHLKIALGSGRTFEQVKSAVYERIMGQGSQLAAKRSRDWFGMGGHQPITRSQSIAWVGVYTCVHKAEPESLEALEAWLQTQYPEQGGPILMGVGRAAIYFNEFQTNLALAQKRRSKTDSGAQYFAAMMYGFEYTIPVAPPAPHLPQPAVSLPVPVCAWETTSREVLEEQRLEEQRLEEQRILTGCAISQIERLTEGLSRADRKSVRSALRGYANKYEEINDWVAALGRFIPATRHRLGVIRALAKIPSDHVLAAEVAFDLLLTDLPYEHARIRVIKEFAALSPAHAAAVASNPELFCAGIPMGRQRAEVLNAFAKIPDDLISPVLDRLGELMASDVAQEHEQAQARWGRLFIQSIRDLTPPPAPEL